MARIISNKKKPVFDLMFSVESNKLHVATPKFVESFLFESPKFSYTIK